MSKQGTKLPAKIGGQVAMMTLLKSGDRQAIEAKFYELLDLYVDEFGNNWIGKELSFAIDIIRGRRIRNSGSVLVVEQILHELEDDCSPGKFISTREVTPEQFKFYSKGLYWLAGCKIHLGI